MVEKTIPDCPAGRGHDWEVKKIEVKGRGSASTYTVSQCGSCGDLLIDYHPEVVAEIGDPS